MRYELLFDLGVREQLEGPYDLPRPVQIGVADCLEELRENPHVGVQEDPVYGLTKRHEQEYGGILWRVVLFFERDDATQIVFVSRFIAYTGEDTSTQPPDEETE
jgi:hypothetical protein